MQRIDRLLVLLVLLPFMLVSVQAQPAPFVATFPFSFDNLVFVYVHPNENSPT